MNQLLSDADKRALVTRLLKDMWSSAHFNICTIDKGIHEWAKEKILRWKKNREIIREYWRTHE